MSSTAQTKGGNRMKHHTLRSIKNIILRKQSTLPNNDYVVIGCDRITSKKISKMMQENA